MARLGLSDHPTIGIPTIAIQYREVPKTEVTILSTLRWWFRIARSHLRAWWKEHQYDVTFPW